MTSPTLLLLCLFATVLELDTTYAFQLTFSRGIIAGPLLSLLTGDLIAGLQVGIFTELLFSDINPLGGVLPPSAVGCCAVTLALNFLGTPLPVAFFLGVLAAFAFAYAERSVRKIRCRWIGNWEKKIMEQPRLINRTVFLSLLTSFASTFLLFSLFIIAGTALCNWLLPHLPEQSLLAFKLAFMAVPWIGITTLLYSFRLKTK